MAKVYADQGNWDKAAEIYRYLLEREPERRDFIHALSEIEEKRLDNNAERLSSLLRQWVELSLKYNVLQKLKKLQGHFGDQ